MPERTYVHPQLVGGADVASDGVAHLDAVARWLQDAAFADGIDAGLGRGSGWIIRRTTLGVERLPRFGERLELTTWAAGLAASTASRRTTIAGEEGAAVEAEAVWVHIDPATRRPARFTEDFLGVYAASAGEGRPRTKLELPAAPPDGAAAGSWCFAAADVDLAGHVNNAVYWRVLEELVPDARRDGAELVAEYRGGRGAGDAEVAASAGTVWVLDPAGAAAAVLATR